MASKKKQKAMVFHQEGAVGPAATSAAERPLACFVPKPANATKGRMAQVSHATSDVADMVGKHNMYPSKEASRTPAVKHPTTSNSHSDNLSPDSICKGIRVTLDNNSMWNEFFRCKTEMILTKQGSRMFPYCRFRISGLNPSRKYSLIMDVQPLDNSRYKWTGKSWQVAGKAESHVKSQPFAHPESPSMGQHWMQNPVSFYKLKLTNNISDRDGNTILHPMHRYLPRLHVVQTDKAAKDIKLNGPSVVTFTFPQTEFIAVIAYQNSRFAQLKVDYNPFAKGLIEDGSTSWGLKLKLNSGKDSHKDGGTETNEHHPVKNSLKSLLANHKPRSSKPSVPGDLQKNSTTDKDQSTAKVTSSPRPAQKLFSELIREAHVSLQRCNMQQLGISNSTEQTNTTTVAGNRPEASKKDSMSTSPARKGATAPAKRKLQEDKRLLNSLNCKDDNTTDCSGLSDVAASAQTQNSVDSDQQCKPAVPSEVNLKQHKRPAPLPLPALALFLKQHSTKSKKVKSKLDSPTSASQSSAAVSACLPSDHSSNTADFSKSLAVVVTETDNQAAGRTGADVHPGEMAPQPFASSVATTDSHGLRTDSPAPADKTLVLPISDQPPCAPLTSPSTISSSLTTSPSCLPSLDSVLPALKSPQASVVTESSTLPSDFPTMKSESLLPDPECSSLGFEHLSPTSSPEALSPLPASLGLELDTSAPGLTQKAHENLQHSRHSVFQWHTVLPPPEPYIDNSFTTFQPTPQPLPIITPFLPSHPEPQPLHTSAPPADPAPSFQETEQSLPFPAELSPLALQLPLSPTFSSLDGDALSPTPSLSDLVHFFSTDDDLGMGVEFSNTDEVAVPCSPPCTVEATAHEPDGQVQPIPTNKPLKRKKSRRQKLGKMEEDQKIDDSSYTKMQPNLEEVEEQLFISFTSKEALRLHIAGSEEPSTPEVHLEPAVHTPEKETLEERISVLQKILLRDLKQMKHRQVIHPVLQEVGLKMNLLDPTLAIDLQYLGVRLPIPDPGVSVEPTQELPSPPGASAAFVSRTGKTTDMTQIKGWREKFTPSEPPSAPSSAQPEAGPSLDLPKKNLSAFCSDMLDEYLEQEGKLIDERAASFSQPQVEPVVYELPTRSTSYVRTLSSILKKQPDSSPASDLISGFIPPSKRPKLSLKEKKMTKKGERKPRGPKPNKRRLQPGADPVSTPEQIPETSLLPTQPTVQTPADAPPSEHTSLVTEPHKLKKNYLKVQFDHTEPLPQAPENSVLKKRRKLKPKSSSQTLSPLRSKTLLVAVPEDMAPLESDSELGAADRGDEPCRKGRGPVMTRALLRQKDLEDGVVWEGRPRTCVTEERAAIALTSLFTLMGFVNENPTAPIQLVRRRAPPCLNEFCRLGCVCSSLSHCSRISHCGRTQCMFGCSCLKQKVVLLKNLDGSDSSPSHHLNNRKRRRRRRMKMAYILKEADSVSKPAKRVRTLWKRDSGGSDPDPVRVPEPSALPRFTQSRENDGSCARVRGYAGKKTTRRQKEAKKDVKSKVVRLKSSKHRDPTVKEPKTKPPTPPPAAEPVQAGPSKRASSPPSEPPPKPSKRLIILAECKWESDADRNHVLKMLCEAMAQDRLGDPFWIKKYLISPLSQTVEENDTDRCIQYKIHISTPKVQREKPPAPPRPLQQLIHGSPTTPQQKQERDTKPQEGRQGDTKPQEGRQGDTKPQEARQGDTKPQEARQGDTKPQEARQGDTKPQEARQGDTKPQQQERPGQVTVEAGPLEDWQQEVTEEELLEDWQREVEEGDIKEDEGSKLDDEKEASKEKMREKMINSMGLPFLTGISPAGFLSANRKKPGGTDHLVQVNGKLYPLAKIQLGKMGALHPANRLAAYLTGRVGSNKDKQVPSSSSVPAQTSGPTLQTISSSSSVRPSSAPPRPQPSVLTIPTSSTDSQANTSVVRPVNPSPGLADSKGSQLLMVEVLSSLGKVPVSGPVTQPPAPSSISQRMVLQPVHTASGLQYYRRPDGKLVRLVPISQLRSGKPNLPVRRVLPHPGLPSPSSLPPPDPPSPSVLPHPGLPSPSGFPPLDPPSPSVLPAAPLQAPAVTAVKQPLTVTTTSTSPVSGLQSLAEPPRSAPLIPGSGFLSQKGACTSKILPTSSNKEQAPTNVVTVPGSFTLLQPHPTPPVAPVNLISLKPSPGGGAGLGVKAMTVSAVPVGKPGVSAPHKPASSQTCTTQTSAETAERPPTPKVAAPPPLPSDRSGPEPEVACNLVDLDIICVDDKTVQVVNVQGSSSSETENSSDFESDAGGEKEASKMNPRLLHNVLERKRRGQLKQLFEGLKREVGLSHEKTSKISALKKAVQLIEELRTTDRRLEREKRRLTKRRDVYLSTVAPTDENRQEFARDQRLRESVKKQREHKNRADLDLMEVVDLLDSSDAEMVVIKTSDSTNDEEEELQRVAMETEDEISRLNAAQMRLARMMRNSESSLTGKKTAAALSDTDAYRVLSALLNTDTCPKALLIEKACQEIQSLQNETQRLKSVKMCLNQQRDSYVTELAQKSGKSKMTVLRKLQQLSSKQKMMEKQERDRTANPVPAPVGGGDSAPPPAGGGVSKPPSTGHTTSDNTNVTSSAQQQMPQAPLNPVSVHTPVHQSQMVLHMSNPVLTPAPVPRDKPKTTPNILSRSKNSAPSLSQGTGTVKGEAPSFQALVPTEVLSLVGVALPGQKLLPLHPLVAGPTVLQTTPTPGVASVTLNIPSLTNQQIHLASLPRLPAGKLYSFSAPLTATNVTATDFTNLLQLVQPATAQKLQPQLVQQLQLPQQQQQVPAGPPPPLPPSLVVSAGSDETKDQDHLPSQTDLRPESSPLSPVSTQDLSSSLFPGVSTDDQSEAAVGGPAGPERQDTRGAGETGNLTSLLTEINFLSQTPAGVSSPGTRSPEADMEDQDHPHSPWVLQLDSDSDDAVTTETDEVGTAGHQTALTNGNVNNGALAPPPLLQMNVGGANVSSPTSSNGPAGGGSMEGGVAWRPMPRLVLLGLRANQSS